MSYPYPAVASIKFKSPPGAPPFSFNKGDRLTVLRQADDEGDWLEGETEGGGGKGVFPASFVERVEKEEQKDEVEAAEPVKQEEGTEESPLAAAIKQGVEQQEGEFPSVDTTSAATPAAAEEKSEGDKSASVEALPPPPPPANPTSPPALSSDAETITDSPRPTASSPPPASSASGPPPPAKKPSGLASRLAFFQQEAEKSKGPAPPPKPKPSGGGWKRPAAPAQPAAGAASSSSPAPAPAPSSATSPPPMARTTSSSSDSASAGGENAGFSAADAQESISRGGGSLRDRIAALSGGFKADQLQPSAAPGRAPKPWKKPQPTSAAADEEGGGAEEKQQGEEQEGEVKDSRPAEEETTAQSPGAEVPPFEPAEAEPSREGTPAPSHAEPAAEAIAEPLPEDDEEEGFAVPETKEEPTEVPAISTSRETVMNEPRPAASLPSMDVDEPSSSSSAVPAVEREGEQDEAADGEQAKRAALAARMAGLGGQKIGLGGAVGGGAIGGGGGGGMIMPALPKRAAGPRRGKSKPAPAAPAAPAVEDENVAEEKPADKEQEQEKKPDVLASMGGASSLLAQNDDDDEEDSRSKVPVDDDDFDSPAPPALASSSAPPPPPSQPQVYDDPPTAPGETVMDEEELAQCADAAADSGEGKTIAQEAVEALPDVDGVRDLEVVPPETAQLEGANDLAEDGKEEEGEEEKAPLARAVAQELGRTNEEFDEEENKPAPPPSRPPPPPTRPVDPPAISSGAETVTDEPRPTAEEPEQEEEEEEDDAPAPPPLPKGRPPIPPSFVRQPTATSDYDNDDGEEDERSPIRPPIPTHPPAINLPPVVTPAEAAFIASQPEILSPPEEAMDESTTGVELDAPSVATIAEGHEARDVELAEADKPHVRDSREEGVATPAFEKSPPVFLPASAKPVGGTSSVSGAAGGVAGKGESLGLAAVLAKKSLEEGKREEASRLVQPPAQQDDGEEAEEAEGEDGEEEEEEEEEEDPEVARRRALAARMAKLGGRGMGPMFGAGFGGLPPASPAKKKTIKKKKTTEEEGEGAPIEQKQPSEQVEEQVVESQSGSEPPSADGHPPRRIGGIPMGGFALPGIVPPRPREAETEPEHEEQHVQPAVEEDVPSTERSVPQDEYDEAKEQQQQEGEEEEQAPPPLPPNRPSGGPPRRSVPVPVAEPEEGEQEKQYVDPAADEDYDQHQAQHASHLVDEPEEHDYPQQEEANEMPPPPPPPRPAGGHQSSIPQSPPLPSMSSIPAQPPARGAPPPPQLPEQNLTRSPTQSSRRSSTFLSGAAEKLGFGGSSSPAQSPRQSMDVDSRFDVERVQGGPLGGVASAPGGGAFAARDVDLDTAGVAWWREGGLPRSLQGRRDVLVDVSESTSTKRGTTRVEKEIEVIYPDLSKTLITASFTSDDLAEATTSIQQSHFPPPAKANLDSLLQWSASLGAQVFAAAHGLKSSSSARGMSDAQLVEQCFAKATDPLLPVGGTYGVKVFEAVVEQGKKGALVAADDEPRAGDIAVISAKFKHALTSKTVGSDQQPHLAIIVGYESKKGKLRVIEVNGKNGNVDEESYKVEDMKAGKVTVFRVAPRDYV